MPFLLGSGYGKQAAKSSRELGSLDEPAQTGPKLNSVGVRGAIDSGGYSAPAAVKTQSKLLGGILKLQIAAVWPAYTLTVTLACSHEPSLRESAEKHPEDFFSNLRLGEFYLENARAARALPYLAQAHRLNIEDAEATQALAAADLQLQKPAAAREVLLTLPPPHRLTQPALLGLVEEAAGHFESAEEQFRLAADSSPNSQTMFAWGAALLLLGDNARAGDIFRRATFQYPHSVELALGTGAVLYNQARSADARQAFLHAALLNPSASAPYLFIASTVDNSDSQQVAELSKSIESLVTAAPRNPQALYALAAILSTSLATGSDGPAFAEVERLLKQATELDPHFADAHLKLASLYAQRGEYMLAIPRYCAAIESDPGLIEAHYRLGQAYMHAGQTEMAQQELLLYRKLREESSGAGDQSTVARRILAALQEDTQPPCAEK